MIQKWFTLTLLFQRTTEGRIQPQQEENGQSGQHCIIIVFVLVPLWREVERERERETVLNLLFRDKNNRHKMLSDIYTFSANSVF